MRLYLDNLVVDTSKGPVRFLISDIQCVILDNVLISVSLQLLIKLITNNVCVILCGANHMPVGMVLSNSGNYASSGKIFDQIKWRDSIKLQLTQCIVRAKIINQSKLLERINSFSASRQLIAYADDVEEGDPTNREGHAAKVYFRALFGSKFTRFDDDVINSGLNYGYAILRSNISTILVSKGMNCNLGIFHRGRSNSFNLSDDVIEVFRPLADWYVLTKLSNSKDFGHQEKIQIAQILNSRVVIDKQNQSLSQGIEIYIERIIAILEEKRAIGDYLVPELIFEYED